MNEGTIITVKSGAATLPQQFALDNPIHRWIQVNAATDSKLGRPFRWLDIGCGQGEYLRRVPEYFQQYASEVEYYGVDQDFRCKRTCEDIARSSGLNKPDIRVGDARTLQREFSGEAFDAVTLINVAHELDSYLLPGLLWTMIDLCAQGGFVYIFDIAELAWHEVEPGALPLNRESSIRLNQFLRRHLGFRRSEPAGLRSRRSGRQAWCIFFEKDWIKAAPAYEDIRDEAAEVLLDIVLRQKERVDGEILDLAHQLNEQYEALAVADLGEVPGEVAEAIKKIDLRFRTSWACSKQLATLQGECQ